MSEDATARKPEGSFDDFEIEPRQGTLIPLKTKAELGAEDVIGWFLH